VTFTLSYRNSLLKHSVKREKMLQNSNDKTLQQNAPRLRIFPCSL